MNSGNLCGAPAHLPGGGGGAEFDLEGDSRQPSRTYRWQYSSGSADYKSRKHSRPSDLACRRTAPKDMGAVVTERSTLHLPCIRHDLDRPPLRFPAPVRSLPEIDMATTASVEDTEKGSISITEKGRKAGTPAWKRGDDEALQVLSEHIGEDPITTEESEKLCRKIDWRVFPIVGFTYGLQSADKAALGISAVFGLLSDLQLYLEVDGVVDSGRYSLVSSMFYIGFLTGAAPLAMISQRFQIGRVCALYCLIWGIIEILTPACKNFHGILALRFFLGFIESGVSPAFLLLISSWYRHQEQALRVAWMYSCSGWLGTIFYCIYVGVAKAVPHEAGTVPDAWREIFYFCGAVTIIWSGVIWLWLPDSPVNATFLSERERYVAVERMREDQGGVRNRTFKLKQGLSCFWDPKMYLIWYCVFAAAVPSGILTNFQSLIFIGVVGAGTYRSVLLSAPGAALGAAFSVGVGYLAQRYRNLRTALYCFSVLICLSCTAVLWRLPLTAKSGLVYGIVTLNVFGGAYSMGLGWTTSNVAGYSRRTVAASMSFVSYCLGNIAGPLLFKKYESPRFPSGFLATTIILAVSFVSAVTYGGLCAYENVRRDRLPPKEVDEAFDDLTDVENKAFRYRL